MIPQPPSGQSPIDPSGAIQPPPSPNGAPGAGGAPYVVPGSEGMAQQQQGAGQFQQQPPVGPPQAPMQQPMGNYPGAYPPGVYPPGMMPQWGAMPPGYGPNMRPPYPPRRRGMFASLVILSVFLLLALSVVMNIVLMTGGSGSATSTMLSSGKSNEQIAVIPLNGLIEENLVNRFDRYMTRASEDSTVKAVVILIDTPGGSVTASDEIYKRIRKFKSNKNVPVVVAMRGMATSGGYYAACGADYIIAERTTLTGNIGVLMPRYNLSKLMDKWGIEESTIVSKGATYKNAGSMFKPAVDRDDAYFQEIADSAFAQFKSVVETGRKGKLKGNIEDIANGKAYTGAQALENGLIDEIDDNGYLDAAVSYATTKAGLSKPSVIKYQEAPSFFDLLGSASKYNGGRTSGGVTINVDASALDRLTSPQMMYLYQTPSSKKIAEPSN